MIKKDYEDIQIELEKKVNIRQKRKRPNMKVSGSSVKKLRNIIIKKGTNKTA